MFPEDVELDNNNNKDDPESEETSSSVPWIDDTDKESSVSWYSRGQFHNNTQEEYIRDGVSIVISIKSIVNYLF